MHPAFLSTQSPRTASNQSALPSIPAAVAILHRRQWPGCGRAAQGVERQHGRQRGVEPGKHPKCICQGKDSNHLQVAAEPPLLELRCESSFTVCLFSRACLIKASCPCMHVCCLGGWWMPASFRNNACPAADTHHDDGCHWAAAGDWWCAGHQVGGRVAGQAGAVAPTPLPRLLAWLPRRQKRISLPLEWPQLAGTSPKQLLPKAPTSPRLGVQAVHHQWQLCQAGLQPKRGPGVLRVLCGLFLYHAHAAGAQPRPRVHRQQVRGWIRQCSSSAVLAVIT